MLYKITDHGDTYSNNNSFGIEVAKLANFPESIIATAHQIAKEISEYVPVSENEKPKKNPTRQKMHASLCKFANINFRDKSEQEIKKAFREIFN